MTVEREEEGRDLEEGGRFSEEEWSPRPLSPKGKVRDYLWERW